MDPLCRIGKPDPPGVLNYARLGVCPADLKLGGKAKFLANVPPSVKMG
ncbi:MAG: hypothetical protein ACE5HS_15115 [bacterium]